jgi:glycosyltransferase involved in cell wall biosynthesis
MISILILTKNEEQDLAKCLESVSWSDDIHVYDSYSTDNTISIAKEFGVKITQREFDNWSAHQNWGLKNINFKYDWVFYIDADERISESLKNNLLNFNGKTKFVAFEIQRRDYAWNNKWLKYTQISPFYLRLFRPDKMRYERLVNPVSIPDGEVGRLNGFLDHYPFSKGIKFWWQRHLSYADLEAKMRLDNFLNGTKFSIITAIFEKDFTKRRYHQKGIFYFLPFRPLIKFIYLFFIRKSFLDGFVGIRYSMMQSIYEYFIVLRTKEIQENKN